MTTDARIDIDPEVTEYVREVKGLLNEPALDETTHLLHSRIDELSGRGKLEDEWHATATDMVDAKRTVATAAESTREQLQEVCEELQQRIADYEDAIERLERSVSALEEVEIPMHVDPDSLPSLEGALSALVTVREAIGDVTETLQEV